MRIKKFFRYFELDSYTLAKFIFNLFNFDKNRCYLVINRTNWQFGKHQINFLVLAIAYKGLAIPIMWALLNKKGCSNYLERIRLLNKFISRFGKNSIAGTRAS